MKLVYFVIVVLVGSLVVPLSAIANELTLRDALERTVQDNPGLQTYPYQQRMAEAEKLQASLMPNPTVGIELENIVGSASNRGIDNAEATLSFSQLVELGDKRSRRVDVASAEQKQLDAEFNYEKVEVLAETARRFYRIVLLQALANWSQQQELRLKDALDIATERVESGAVPPSEVTRIRLQQRQTVANSEEITGKIAEAKSNLSAMWAAEPHFSRVVGEFDDSIHLPSTADVESAVNQAPEFLRLVDSERLLAAKANALEAASVADLTLGVGVRYNNQFNESSLVLQASMPLQLTNPNQGLVRSNQAERDLLLDQQRIVREQLRVYTRAILARLQMNQNYLERIQLDLLPLAQQLAQETTAGYVKGIHNLLMVLDAQEELAQLEYEQINRRYAIYQDILELERMTGQSFLESAL